MNRQEFKIGHISDLHFCTENYKEATKCTLFAIEKAIEENVDCFVISGDSTERRLDAHSPAFITLLQMVQKIANHCPVFMLQGTFSHEPIGFLEVFKMISANFPIHVSTSIEMVGLSRGNWIPYDPLDQNQPDFDVVISSMPTVNKADLINLVPTENISSEMGNVIAGILASFAPANSRLRDSGVPTILVSHGTVSGSLNETGVPMAGPDHEFTLGTLYSANTDAVLLGHIHLSQQWERRFNGVHQMIAYAGSVGRYHYGDLEDKYYLQWSFSSFGLRLDKFVTPSRKSICIDFDGVPDLDQLKNITAECKDAFIRVKYSVDEEHINSVDHKAIKEILGEASEVKIQRDIMTIQRQRCPGISNISSISEQFAEWCKHTQTPIEGLEERLQLLMNSEPFEIASKLISST